MQYRVRVHYTLSFDETVEADTAEEAAGKAREGWQPPLATGENMVEELDTLVGAIAEGIVLPASIRVDVDDVQEC